MPTITNTTKSDLITEAGVVLPARSGVEFSAEDARALSKSTNPVIKAWFEAGALTSDAPEVALQEQPVMPSGSSAAPSDVTLLNDDELRAFLTSADIRIDNRWGRDRLLQEALKVQPKV